MIFRHKKSLKGLGNILTLYQDLYSKRCHKGLFSLLLNTRQKADIQPEQNCLQVCKFSIQLSTGGAYLHYLKENAA